MIAIAIAIARKAGWYRHNTPSGGAACTARMHEWG